MNQASSRVFRVMKFGGSSVGDAERLAAILTLVRSSVDCEGLDLALVVSAPGDTTDWLIEAGTLAAAGQLKHALSRVDDILQVALQATEQALARHHVEWRQAKDALAPLCSELCRLLGGVAIVSDFQGAVRDHVLSFGERVASTLVAGACTALGVTATGVDARTWLVTDECYGNASVLWTPTLVRVDNFVDRWRACVTVHTGFIGATERGVTTTLGRNGSDYTATLLARALGADEVNIFTDVPGVMTADPSIEREAYPVPRLSYAEALELAGLGLRMFHPRTMVPLIESGIPMRIRSTLAPGAPGTLVDRSGSTDPKRPTCVCSLEELVLIDVSGTQRTQASELGSRVLAGLSAEGLPTLFSAVAAYGNGVAVAVERRNGERALACVRETLRRELDGADLAEPTRVEPVTVVTLVAEAMGQTVGVAARFFGALARAGVLIRASTQGASSRAISAVIDARETAVAVRAVHAAFNLAREQVSVLLLGKGTVGRELAAQIVSERDKLARDHNVELNVVSVADSTGVVFDEQVGAVQLLLRLDEPTSSRVTLSAALKQLARQPVPVMVDCTAADGMAELYIEALEQGVHVVSANKKPLVLAVEQVQSVHAAARSAHRGFRYETTCGAGLPVIETLKNLVRTGDVVQLVEASLSGTLGFLCDAVGNGVLLSQAVREALRRGYTEPHPRDDLTGLDAARKAVILARELDLPVNLSDIQVEPMVPHTILAEAELDRFFSQLEAFDATFWGRVTGLRSQARSLRYLASIDLRTGSPSIRVGPTAVSELHPASRLRGSEVFVAFTTQRYADYPLVIQGPGAGGAVTAAGVLADILSLSQTLRGA